MTSAEEVLSAFENIRRAQRSGIYAPHKPLLILLALARVQHEAPRLVEFSAIDEQLRGLLVEFGPSSAAKNRHYPFWHLASDDGGSLWSLEGPQEILRRPPSATPTVGELRRGHIKGGFAPSIDHALREVPGLIQAVAIRVLDSFFPSTIQQDICDAVGLDVSPTSRSVRPAQLANSRRRSSSFRERVLRAYEYRCCVCGFDLRIGQVSAGLEAAHIQWYQAEGPDVEENGLSLCALHHKLFDLGVFTVNTEHRILFSQHAIMAQRDDDRELRHHGQKILPTQDKSHLPLAAYVEWNRRFVFKDPVRPFEQDSVSSK